jgi:hypothetical protein
MSTIDIIKTAFRKLKASVYFDKTMLPLRDKVVEFEVNKDFDAKLQELAQVYDNASCEKSVSIMSEILDTITALPFPKKTLSTLSTLDKKHDVISIGNPKERAVVSELQYFIDMDVRGHILGILWILKFGKRLDNECYQHSFGNRLRQSLIWDEESGDIQDSPALFEPYFGQYSLWRDGGLSCAEEVLQKGQDALILTLDLRKFYYNAGITQQKFEDLLSSEGGEIGKQLHSIVFTIIERYTEVLKKKSIELSENVLPIGFLPSAVLSNWCLSNFDNGILNYWNPLYYGRYVDDIIIVEKFEKNSEIYQKARGNSLTSDAVINYFLGGKRNNNTHSFLKSIKDDEGITYRVNATYCLSKLSNLEFQSDKTRVFALFSDNNSTALLNKFKKQIYENVSEFRLMPEIGDAFSQDDFSRFYRLELENDATINKLRGIKNIIMDKFELSKFLGKYRVISSLVDDGNAKKFTGIIGKMFNERELIDNYILWERVLEIFITDKDYKGLSKFVKRITDSIKSLELNNDTHNETKNVKESLRRHLMSSINRVLSLLWGKEATVIIEKFDKESFLTPIELRKSYISVRMSNKYIMAIPVEVIKIPNNKKNINFTDFKCSLYYLLNTGIADVDTSVLLPYFQQAQDIATVAFLRGILGTPVSKENYINEIACLGSEKPIDTFSVAEGDNRGISVGKHKNGNLKMAVANVNVSKVYSLERVLKGKNTNRKYGRYKELANIVNAAIKENADMLVLPENYVPFEWLLPLAAKAAHEGLAIVTGIEHIVLDKTEDEKGKKCEPGKVYNYTAVILPFKYFDSIPTAAVFFQLKKHYSPEEARLIEGYTYCIPKTDEKRPLYRWNDCYFPVYCCYELAAINDRAEFISWADMVVAVEFNKDTSYFSSIVESLARDLHCYCVQVNTSEYGDSRIVQPTRNDEKNILSVKGGLNQTLLVGEISISELREFQLKKYTLQKDSKFKPTPPGIDVEIVRNKNCLCSKN